MHSHFRDQKGLMRAFRNGFAPMKLFNAIPLPSFSAAVNCASQPLSFLLIFCSRACLHPISIGKVVLDTAQPSSAIIASDSLEEQQRLEKRCWGFQGGMPLWSQGEAREGEAVNPKGERWKGESETVPPPKKVVMAKPSRSLQPSQKAPFITKIEMLPSKWHDVTGMLRCVMVICRIQISRA